MKTKTITAMIFSAAVLLSACQNEGGNEITETVMPAETTAAAYAELKEYENTDTVPKSDITDTSYDPKYENSLNKLFEIIETGHGGFLYDFNMDNIPELAVKRWGVNLDYSYDIYNCENGVLMGEVYLGAYEGDWLVSPQLTLYYDKDNNKYFYVADSDFWHNDYHCATAIKYEFENCAITTTVIAQCKFDYTVGSDELNFTENELLGNKTTPIGIYHESEISCYYDGLADYLNEFEKIAVVDETPLWGSSQVETGEYKEIIINELEKCLKNQHKYILLESNHNPAEESGDVKAAKFLGSDECLSLEWEFGTFIDINNRPHEEIILWHEDELGNLIGTAFDVSGDSPENMGTFAADIGEDGFLIPARRLHQTTELYFTPLIKTENGCHLMRYPFSEDGIGEGEIIAEFNGDISDNRRKAAEYLADYWSIYTSHIAVKRDFERGHVEANPYSAVKDKDFFTGYCHSQVDYCYFHADYLVLPETVRANGISVHMREEDVLAALGVPDKEEDHGEFDDGHMKGFYYGNNWVELFLDEASGIWLVDSYYFGDFTTSIGISSGMTRRELLDSEIGDKLHADYYDYTDDGKTVENADVLTTGEWKYGEIKFIFDGDIIEGIAANNGTSI